MIGVVIERVAFAPLRSRPDTHFAGLISSISLAIIFGAITLAVFGPNTVRFPPDTFPSTRYEVFGASISLLQLVILAVSIALMITLQWLVTRTRLGTAMRAVAEDPRAARVLGLNVEQVTITTFALSSALGAAAGVLFALAFNSIRFDMGLSIELKGLAVIVVGGMGSLTGAMLGGLILGLAEVYAVASISSSWRDAIAFGLLFLILVLRPQGLLGRVRVREV